MRTLKWRIANKGEWWSCSALVLLGASLCAARAITITVTSIADSGVGSLRAALTSAANGDTIDVTGISGAILLTSGELLVTNSVTIVGSGANNLVLNGNAVSRVFHIGSNTIVSISRLTITNGFGDPGGGIYNDSGLGGNATLKISDCRLVRNYGSDGGGIYNENGNLSVNGCYFSGNSGGLGGGIANEGSKGKAVVLNSTFIGNGATSFGGGGIYNAGTLAMTNSIMSSNWVVNTFGDNFDGGGGLLNAGDATAVNTIFSANSAKSDTFFSSFIHIAGGGVNSSGTMSLVNSTIRDNRVAGQSDNADYIVFGIGGGIFNGGTMTIVGATIVNNTTSDTEGNSGNIYTNNIDNCDIFSGGVLTLVNSTLDSSEDVNDATYHQNSEMIVLNSTLWHESFQNLSGKLYVGSTILSSMAFHNSSGIITSYGYNLSSDNGSGFLTGLGDQINTDPMLGPLQDNGGPTFTHALIRGSPAIDQGKNFAASTFDQRGRLRTYNNPAIPAATGGDESDIGAVEFFPPILSIDRNFQNVALSWPTNDSGYTVESTPVLPNAGSWTTVPGTPLVIGNLYLLGDGPATSNKFYRLRSP